MIKKLLLLIVFVTTFSYGDIGSWFENKVNNVVGIKPGWIHISNLTYSGDTGPVVFFPNSSTESTRVSARVKNLSKEETIKTIVFVYEVLECNSSGNNCTTIDEEERRWKTNIPPGQARYYDDTIYYNKGDSNKSIYFRQKVKYVYPYDI